MQVRKGGRERDKQGARSKSEGGKALLGFELRVLAHVNSRVGKLASLELALHLGHTVGVLKEYDVKTVVDELETR